MAFGSAGLRLLPLGAALLLAACGGPDLVRLQPVAELRVEGFDLDVYRSGETFAVVRVTRDYRSEGDFVWAAIRATERVTGCLVLRGTVRGGPERIVGRLDC